MCQVTEIQKHCGASLAGLFNIHLINVDDIVTIPTPTTDWVIVMDIILAAGKSFVTIPFKEESAGLVDDIADAVGGGFQKTLNFKVSRVSAALNEWINNIIGTRLIAIIEDRNGQMILVGSLTQPMRMQKASAATGQKTGDENAWDIQMLAESPKPCYFYNGTLPLQMEAITTEDNLFILTEDGQYIYTE
jgi:hypothetical protein